MATPIPLTQLEKHSQDVKILITKHIKLEEPYLLRCLRNLKETWKEILLGRGSQSVCVLGDDVST